MTADLEARMGDYRERVYGLRPGVRTMIPGPLYHSAPNSFALRAARVAGLIALMPRFDPEAFLALVETHRIEAMFMVPTMFVRLLKLPADVRKRYDLSSLKFVMHAAAPCPPDVKRGMIEWLGPVVHDVKGYLPLVCVGDEHLDWDDLIVNLKRRYEPQRLDARVERELNGESGARHRTLLDFREGLRREARYRLPAESFWF